MAKIAWTTIGAREFEYLVPMTEDQKAVFRDMVAGASPVHTAMNNSMSVRKVEYIRHWIRERYSDVKKFSPLL